MEELASAGTLTAGPTEPLARLLSAAMNDAALRACDGDRELGLGQVGVALSEVLSGLRR